MTFGQMKLMANLKLTIMHRKAECAALRILNFHSVQPFHTFQRLQRFHDRILRLVCYLNYLVIYNTNGALGVFRSGDFQMYMRNVVV